MAIVWTNTQDEIAIRGIKVLVYGRSGCGKTVLGATAPKPLIASVEEGLLSLSPENLARIYDKDKMPYSANIPVAKLKTKEDCEEFLKLCKTEGITANFETIIFDSLSEIAESVLDNELPKHKDGRQAYMKTQEFIIKWIKDLRALTTLNIVFITKQDSIKNDVTGVILQGPWMPGQQMGKNLPYLFDLVLYYGLDLRDAKNVRRYIQTAADAQNEAKDRSGKLDMMEYPHLGYLFNKIKGTV